MEKVTKANSDIIQGELFSKSSFFQEVKSEVTYIVDIQLEFQIRRLRFNGLDNEVYKKRFSILCLEIEMLAQIHTDMGTFIADVCNSFSRFGFIRIAK